MTNQQTNQQPAVLPLMSNERMDRAYRQRERAAYRATEQAEIDRLAAYLAQQQRTDEQPFIPVFYWDGGWERPLMRNGKGARPAHVMVGRFRPCHEGMVGGAMCMEMGVNVGGTLGDLTEYTKYVGGETVWARDVYDAQVINKLGQPGAYVPTPPDDERLDAAIERVRLAVAAALMRTRRGQHAATR